MLEDNVSGCLGWDSTLGLNAAGWVKIYQTLMVVKRTSVGAELCQHIYFQLSYRMSNVYKGIKEIAFYVWTSCCPHMDNTCSFVCAIVYVSMCVFVCMCMYACGCAILCVCASVIVSCPLCPARCPASFPARCPARCPASHPTSCHAKCPASCPASCPVRCPASRPARCPARHPASH